MAKAGLPLALLFILSACGGSTAPEATPASRTVAGPGFRIAVPQDWTVRKTRTSVTAKQYGDLVSVTQFPLLKAYDPSKFDAASKELDRVAAQLASKHGTTLSTRETTTVDGRRVRAYRFTAGGTDMRIGFVLDGKTEYQLVCSGDTAAPCDLLFSSFTVA
jgi:hypothetical protein